MDHRARRALTAHSLRPSWHGTAFIVEAIVLLALLAGCIALFMQLFSAALLKGAENENLSHAIVLATNSAERFAIDPEGAACETMTEDGFLVLCSVSPEETEGGTLYRADIVVSNSTGDIYRLATAKYRSGVAR